MRRRSQDKPPGRPTSRPGENLPRKEKPPPDAKAARGMAMPFDQRENLRDAILQKKARIAEIERTLNRPPLTEYRGRPVSGGEGWRLRLEEDRQHLLIAVAELEQPVEREDRPAPQAPAPLALARGRKAEGKPRLTEREQKIAKVIARGSKSTLYCREL